MHREHHALKMLGVVGEEVEKHREPDEHRIEKFIKQCDEDEQTAEQLFVADGVFDCGLIDERKFRLVQEVGAGQPPERREPEKFDDKDQVHDAKEFQLLFEVRLYLFGQIADGIFDMLRDCVLIEEQVKVQPNVERQLKKLNDAYGVVALFQAKIQGQQAIRFEQVEGARGEDREKANRPTEVQLKANAKENEIFAQDRRVMILGGI